jgi:O-antigen/teichoic acid export membrane protein
MAEMKRLVKDTAIYGVSSILGRAINWCLSPFYTYTLADTTQFGVVSQLYAWTAVLLVLLTYGMETGFFRFANKHAENAKGVFTTTLTSLGITSTTFVLLMTLFLNPICGVMNYENHPEYVWMIFFVVAIDAFNAIPYAWLRFQKRPIFFASVSLATIFVNVFFNVFFLWACPKINAVHPEWIHWFYRPDFGVGYVILSNVFSTLVGFILLSTTWIRIRWTFDRALLRSILKYSLPLMVLGVAGVMNQSLDKILFEYLLGVGDWARSQLGIYTACFKLGIVMMLFTQAFRYAYEPFVFSKNKQSDSKEAYVTAMKYYVIFSVFVFLGVMYYADVLQLLINKAYRVGMVVVPIVLVTYIFQGICFNLSFWYKLSDKTNWGAIITIIGLVITVLGNVLFVPAYGYMASAWASFVCFLVMMIVSWAMGQKHYPIAYDLKSALKYLLVGAAFYALGMWANFDSLILRLLVRNLLLVGFVAFVIWQDLPLKSIPLLNRWAKRS